MHAYSVTPEPLAYYLYRQGPGQGEKLSMTFIYFEHYNYYAVT